LKEFDLNVDFCVGVAPDGCSVMTSQKVRSSEGSSERSQECSLLCLLQSSFEFAHFSLFTDSKYSPSSDVIKEAILFLTSSAKCSVIVISIHDQKIRKLCETRRIERIESIAE
jgi:hypothetical protein